MDSSSILTYVVGFVWLIVLVVIWSGIWKAVALWKTARNNDLGWFIAFCLVNTLGILEILYIYVFSKNKSNPEIKTN